MKVAVVFDNRPRQETTGLYCRRALARLADVEHLLPEELEHIPPGLFDLLVVVDDGLDYFIPDHCRPRAAWAIDTHVDFERTVRRFGDADFLFAAQKNGASRLQERLGRDVHWLPLACDSEIHRPLKCSADTFSVAFVGHLIGERRCWLLEQIQSRFDNACVTQALFDDMARAYGNAKIGFNCSIADDLNMRLFEVPSFGIPLVTNQIDGNGLTELFTPGEHLLTYRDEAELMAVLERLLADESLRQRIAAAGQRLVLNHHTYDHRMRTLLSVVQAASERTPTIAVNHTSAVTSSIPRRSSTSNAAKNRDYFEFPRPDVQSLVPPTANRILDIGCGGGRLGAELKRRQSCHVTGVEANIDAAHVARDRLDEVVNKSIESLDESHFLSGSFDCIILADVLEHLRDPLTVLRKCRQWLADDGRLVISIPNSRHHSVISGLIRGNWSYEPAGLLDEDHVRCFTRREMEKLLFRAGFDVDALAMIPGSGHSEWLAAGRPGEVQFESIHITGIDPADAEEFYVYQYLFRGRPAKKRSFGLTSIIIVTFNQLPFTRECLDSIRIRTDEPYELIFIDNGSTDGTPDYLRTIPGATVICNADNRGFAQAVNMGLAVCRGEQILLLNNDTVVTTGWLRGLLEALHDHPSNGLVGPVSNSVSGPQQIDVTYRDLTSLDGFAWDQRNNRELLELDRLVGFCLLFRRSVMERIGILDEQFRVGNFEDDDYCRRARQAGYRALIVPGVFIHHYGSASFRGAGLDLGQILAENEARYIRKWSDPQPSETPVIANEIDSHASVEWDAHRYDVEEIPEIGPLLRRREIRLSLCMIVRDNEDTIDACLDSIYPWVDEIIVVDTGSKDRTPDICRRFGARMFEFPWCDDFSAARNKSLEPARGEWIFWMDSDDVIPEEQGRQLRSLVYGIHASDCLGYVMQVHCLSDEPGQMTVVDHVKVFRNLPELRFEHRIHEQILPAIRRLGGSVAFTDIHVLHSGSRQTPETRQRKLERDFRILKLDLAERPDHPFILFNLGMTYEDAGDYVTAETYLRRSIEVASPGESHLRKAWALLVNCHSRTGNADSAVDLATSALGLFPGDKELLFRRAILLQHAGRFTEAADEYRRILDEDADRVFVSLDPAITGFKLHYNLACVLGQLGEPDQAIRHWALAIQDCPQFSPAWLSLGRMFAELNRAEELTDLLSRIPLDNTLAATRAVISAFLASLQNDMLAVQRILSAAWKETRDSECLDELCRLLTEKELHSNALPYLRELASVRPNEPAVLRNLGLTLQICGHPEESQYVLARCQQMMADFNQTL